MENWIYYGKGRWLNKPQEPRDKHYGNGGHVTMCECGDVR